MPIVEPTLPADIEEHRRFLKDSQKAGRYAYEGLRMEESGSWFVQLRRADRKCSWFYGRDPREALLRARVEVEAAIREHRELRRG